jgi:hypothetical protein
MMTQTSTCVPRHSADSAEQSQHPEAPRGASPQDVTGDGVVERLDPVEGSEIADAFRAPESEQQADAAAPPNFDDAVLAGFRIGYRADAAQTAKKTLAAGATATQTILEMAGWIQDMKSRLNRKEFGAFVKDLLQWVGDEARKYLDLARAFEGFDLDRLQRLEPFTLLKLRTKRYAPVVQELLSAPIITPKVVQDLIKELLPKKPRKQNRKAVGQNAVLQKHANTEDGTFYFTLKEANLSEQIGSWLENKLEFRSLAQVLQQAQSREEQLEELPLVVDNARQLEREKRQLQMELGERDQRIADLQAKLTNRASASSHQGEKVEDLLEQRVRSRVEMAEFPLKQEIARLRAQLQNPANASVVVEQTVATLKALDDEAEAIAKPASTTLAQSADAPEHSENQLAITADEPTDRSEVIEEPTTATALEEAQEQVQPTNQPEKASDSRAGDSQGITPPWEQIKQLRGAESYLQEIESHIKKINSDLTTPRLEKIVENQLRDALSNRQKLRSNKIAQIVNLADAKGIPTDYEALRSLGRVVLAPEYASGLLRQAKSWSDVAIVVGSDRNQLLRAVKSWPLEEKQLLVNLLSSYLEIEAKPLASIDWIPNKLLLKALSSFTFTLQKIRKSDNLVDEPEMEYLSGCKLVSVQNLGERQEQWVFEFEGKNIPVFSRDEFTIEKF